MKKLRMLSVIVVMLVLVAGACCPKLVSEKADTKIKIEYRDSIIEKTVYVPEKVIQHDTVVKELEGKVKTKIVIEKNTEKMYMRTVIDSLGNVTMECISAADTLAAKIKVQNERITVQREIIREYEKREQWWKTLLRKVIIGIAVVIAIAGGLMYIFLKLKP